MVRAYLAFGHLDTKRSPNAGTNSALPVATSKVSLCKARWMSRANLYLSIRQIAWAQRRRVSAHFPADYRQLDQPPCRGLWPAVWTLGNLGT